MSEILESRQFSDSKFLSTSALEKGADWTWSHLPKFMYCISHKCIKYLHINQPVTRCHTLLSSTVERQQLCQVFYWTWMVGIQVWMPKYLNMCVNHGFLLFQSLQVDEKIKGGFKKFFLILSILIKSEMVTRDCCKGKTEGTQYFVNSNFCLMEKRIWWKQGKTCTQTHPYQHL